MVNVVLIRVLVAALAFALAACASQPRTPSNLGLLKLEIRAYVERGDYQRDLEVVGSEAKTWIQERAGRGGGKLTVVFDLDETLFSNWPHMSAMDFGYVKTEWRTWVDAGQAPAIEPVREIYRTARRLGLEVVLITGRTQKDRKGTERNLQAIGCVDYQTLVFKPDGDERSTAAFKTVERQRLVAGGRVIIANIGDQESDLAGGYAERTFKLPNVFYFSP